MHFLSCFDFQEAGSGVSRALAESLALYTGEDEIVSNKN